MAKLSSEKAPEMGTEQAVKTADVWTVPKGEENTVHARIQYRQFNPQTGERQFKPRIVTFEKNQDWPAFLNDPMNYEILEVLHLPEGAITPAAFYEAKAEQAKKEAARIADARARR